MSFKIHIFRYYICYLLVHCFIGLPFVLLPPLCSDVPPSHYLEWMKQGINIITPNKKLGSGPLEQYTAVKKVQRESYIQFVHEVRVRHNPTSRLSQQPGRRAGCGVLFMHLRHERKAVHHCVWLCLMECPMQFGGPLAGHGQDVVGWFVVLLISQHETAHGSRRPC